MSDKYQVTLPKPTRKESTISLVLYYLAIIVIVLLFASLAVPAGVAMWDAWKTVVLEPIYER